MIHKAVKIRAYPTQAQRRLFARTEGACRYVYNHALDALEKSYQQKKAGVVQKAEWVIGYRHQSGRDPVEGYEGNPVVGRCSG